MASAVLMFFPFVFTACSLGGITEKTTIIHTDKLQPAINLALKSSVLIQTNHGSGSGVIYEINGSSIYIITNWHVIAKDANGTNSNPNDDADPSGYYAVSPASVLEMDDRGNLVTNAKYRAETNMNGVTNDEDDVKLLGGSSYYDIAILKVTNTDLIDAFNLTAATVFNGRLAYGDTAFAVGNSLGMGISVTEGIVSVPGEYIVDTDILPKDGQKGYISRRVIRTTAATQQGNSGGGLFNGAGELIGIMQSKSFYTGSVGVDEIVHSSNLPIDNIAYAVPTDIAARIASQMIKRDRAGEFADDTRNKDNLIIPYVGVTLGSANKRADDTVPDTVYYIEDVLVDEIATNCNINFESKDIIRKVVCDGKELSNIIQVYQIREFLIECYTANTVTFFVERAGEAGLLELSGAFFEVSGDRP